MPEIEPKRRAEELPVPEWIAKNIGAPREWQPYSGYRKRHCDVRLADGTEIRACWPNAGVFHELHGDLRQTPEVDVMHVRYYGRA